MKPQSVISLLFGLSVSSAWSQSAPSSRMRDAATHEQLALTYRKASQEDPMRNMQPAKGPDPSTAAPPRSLIGDSDIICFNGMVTLVPKRAVLQIPKNKGERLKYQLGSKLMSWADFYAVNRGWITTVEVSRAQAEGNEAIKEEVSDRISKSSNLVVATYQGGPISVLPLKAPVENETANAKSKP